MGKNVNIRKVREGGLTHIHTEMSKDAVMMLDEIGDYIKNNLASSYFTVGDHLTSPYKEKRYSENEIKVVIEEMLHRVRRYNETHEKPKCISGVEANVITNGVDIPDSLLERIGFVIASRHFPWGNEGPQQIAANLIAAMENAHIDALGHINRHVDATVDWDSIFQTAEKTRTFIEINFDTPPSQDLLRIMSRYQLLYTVGVDFHTFQGLKKRIPTHSQIVADLAEARKITKEKTEQSDQLKKEYLKEPVGYKVLKQLVTILKLFDSAGIPTRNIVNTLPYDEFINLIKRPKGQRTL